MDMTCASAMWTLTLVPLTVVASGMVVEGTAMDVAGIRAAVAASGAPFATHNSSAFYDRYAKSMLARHPVTRHGNDDADYHLDGITIPTHYSVKEAFPNCTSPTTIFDQGKCGGCWALSVAASMSDRLCQNGVDVILSPQDLLDCVGGKSKGCSGGFAEDGFDYMEDEGLRTNNCVPFHAMDGYCIPSGRCQTEAATEGATSDKYYAGSWAQYISSRERVIQEEILARGSISAVFEVFGDFFLYKSGVYRHVSGDYSGLHAVTLVGWGESQSEGNWWLVKNSWGSDFGEKGFFRIARGIEDNGCNFEGGLTAATVR